jgi:hypothetical protein
MTGMASTASVSIEQYLSTVYEPEVTTWMGNWRTDPGAKKAYRYDGTAVVEVRGSLTAGELALPLEKLFG